MPRFCEVCKQPIDVERAEALPETKLCEVHAKAILEFGGESIRVNEEERSNKVESLKKNVSGVKTKKVRNMAAMEKLRKKIEESS